MNFQQPSQILVLIFWIVILIATELKVERHLTETNPLKQPLLFSSNNNSSISSDYNTLYSNNNSQAILFPKLSSDIGDYMDANGIETIEPFFDENGSWKGIRRISVAFSNENNSDTRSSLGSKKKEADVESQIEKNNNSTRNCYPWLFNQSTSTTLSDPSTNA
ncbi:hypothetical protein HK099_004795 [Clydaea vesicula]|uniref:Uncharacterized protein n=1 Tax=Clydaea vesicula TaxID=447962 RepID=A0AAD5U9C2_9FUNG|nr:hypothetical protein HK099_004795 [Clydaea vesicula]